jgi:pyruvate/2-oxoglutarate dehydrogenase complex dihydrolipoamide acyltransferase (E2) component
MARSRAAAFTDFPRARFYSDSIKATALIMPKQGRSVESCAFVGWKMKVGDAVRAGEVLCKVETDKATFEVETPASGTLLEISHDRLSAVKI